MNKVLVNQAKQKKFNKIFAKLSILKIILTLPKNKFWLSLCQVKFNKFSTFLRKKDVLFLNTGFVISIIDGIAKIYGLKSIRAGELVQFQSTLICNNNNITGLALSLELNLVGIVIFGKENLIKQGYLVKRSFSIISINIDTNILSRVLDPLGNPIDGIPLNKSSTLKTKKIDIKAPGILKRFSVHQPIQTGLLAIDSLTPIGKGQRQLIIGDKQVGKTAIAIDTIINQKKSRILVAKNFMNFNVKYLICIYVAIGQKRSTVAKVVKKLKSEDCLNYSIIIAATASDSASLQYLAPYTGSTIGEFFRDKGGHALVIFDDLTKQAIAYRQIALLLRRPPSREAYPSDVFYLHSRLLERSSKLFKFYGSGSLTSFPIVETQSSDVSSYIPTNTISITDGVYIFLKNVYTYFIWKIV